ncbi:hypothetical protein D9757_002527 [Collybiopsis confluens]|uniref:TEA domain-containing protein n=1 Tax=Collybiopsis confluens TaxID=2823264 RepID=A0A8H5HYA0_9AGAR|nr:hypothetical protein D9757_002527 [Collybiopsis confluens]
MSLSNKTKPKPHVGFICMSTVEDLSYTPSAEEKSRDAAQIVATGRRSWKTLKGRGEAVWPPQLEAALIEALEKYKPDESRSNKSLGRFSMRNRFISDYIHESTGKRRTPKQVGSRLQQMRDTCKSDKIMQLISRRHFDNDGDSGGSNYSESPSTSPVPEHHISHNISAPRTIWVNLVLEQSWSSPPPVINLVNNQKIMTLVIHLAPNPSARHPSSGYGSLDTNSLSGLESSITIASPFILESYSSFTVFLEGVEHPMHRESAPLIIHSSMQNSGSVYSTSLVPGFWQSICDSAAPTRYTIVQDLFLAQNVSGPSKSRAPISIVYNFMYPESSTEFLLAPSHNHFSSMNEPLDSTLTRGWGHVPMNSNDVDWSPSFSSHRDSRLNIVTSNSDINSRYDLPTFSRNSRGLAPPTESWAPGPRYTQQVLPYC